jgi:thiosulfate reductase cytochrome b subunit
MRSRNLSQKARPGPGVIATESVLLSDLARFRTSTSAAEGKPGLTYPPLVPAAVIMPVKTEAPRHSALVRVTHWLTVAAFFALLITGGEIVISHPRFYWGEVGNVNTHPLFTLRIPASRDTVPTGYGYVMRDQNGWSRYLHFEAAWVLALTGLVYGIAGLWSGHFRRNLIPEPRDRSWRAYWQRIAKYLRRAPPDKREERSYNVLQRTAYLGVIFVLFPLVIWTGLAMSPAFTAACPLSVILLGGRQSARTIHFFVSWLLLFFLVVHVAMIVMAGFWSRMWSMITGRVG